VVLSAELSGPDLNMPAGATSSEPAAGGVALLGSARLGPAAALLPPPRGDGGSQGLALPQHGSELRRRSGQADRVQGCVQGCGALTVWRPGQPPEEGVH
jgi:hypothetical protein